MIPGFHIDKQPETFHQNKLISNRRPITPSFPAQANHSVLDVDCYNCGLQESFLHLHNLWLMLQYRHNSISHSAKGDLLHHSLLHIFQDHEPWMQTMKVTGNGFRYEYPTALLLVRYHV